MHQHRTTRTVMADPTAFAWQALLTVALCVYVPFALGDVGPPVSIQMPTDRTQAVSGQECSGEFLVQVYKPGTLTDFRLA